MPLYEYQCGQCGVRFEIFQAIGEGSSGLTCPKCHAPDPKRLVSSFATPDPAREPPKKNWRRGMSHKEITEENVVMPSGRTAEEEKEIVKRW